MSNFQLTELEIRDLLNRYRSEMRKLQYQMDRTQQTLEELSSIIGAEAPAVPVQYTGTQSQSPAKKRGPGRPPKKRGPGRPPKKKRGPGRPPKSESSGETKRGPGRPPKKRGPGRPPKKKRGPGRPPKRSRSKSGSYKLSDWDEFLIKSIDEAGKPLINKELAKRAQEWDEAKKLPKSEIKQYISRSIHKLANKHNTLKKVPYEGRGYAYATDKMVFNNGKLKKEYER